MHESKLILFQFKQVTGDGGRRELIDLVAASHRDTIEAMRVAIENARKTGDALRALYATCTPDEFEKELRKLPSLTPQQAIRYMIASHNAARD
ncbi:hypothetical protein [Stieleria varia]|uniref:Uncharacterized protein n=1 Tax=Stieleria varia TaxID=2528005 RepID=A0A5C6B8U8_9BACT|nr:hypothetical protein [Stieleria varia]TWU08390.1 hypothetical protein Pla52n_09720 [Stieleria varia]